MAIPPLCFTKLGVAQLSKILLLVIYSSVINERRKLLSIPPVKLIMYLVLNVVIVKCWVRRRVNVRQAGSQEHLNKGNITRQPHSLRSGAQIFVGWKSFEIRKSDTCPRTCCKFVPFFRSDTMCLLCGDKSLTHLGQFLTSLNCHLLCVKFASGILNRNVPPKGD